MRNLFARLWNDDQGALIAAEYLFMSTILVIGIVLGLTNLRDAINTELTELGRAITALSQGYTISGGMGPGGSFDGSGAFDTPGFIPPSTPVPPLAPSFID